MGAAWGGQDVKGGGVAVGVVNDTMEYSIVLIGVD